MTRPSGVELALRASLGLALVLVGGFLVALSLGYEPAMEGELHAPGWVAALAGVMMAGAGLAFMAPNQKVLGWALATLVLGGGAAIGLWVGLASDPDQIAGGLPFLPQGANRAMGRVAFATGGLVCGALLLYGLWLGPSGTGPGPSASRDDHQRG